jgi:hypothetical protein
MGMLIPHAIEIGSDPFEAWWDVRNDAGGGGGGSAHHHAMGSAGEPPGPRVPLLLLARSDCSRFFTAFVIFQSPATAAAQEVEVVVAQGAEMAVEEGEAEKTRRRDDLGDDLGETVVATAI